MELQLSEAYFSCSLSDAFLELVREMVYISQNARCAGAHVMRTVVMEGSS